MAYGYVNEGVNIWDILDEPSALGFKIAGAIGSRFYLLKKFSLLLERPDEAEYVVYQYLMNVIRFFLLFLPLNRQRKL